jgi:hypothetical protein
MQELRRIPAPSHCQAWSQRDIAMEDRSNRVATDRGERAESITSLQSGIVVSIAPGTSAERAT